MQPRQQPSKLHEELQAEQPQQQQHQPQRARRWTQILFVLIVSFGAFIHGTTVTLPAVFIPGLQV